MNNPKCKVLFNQLIDRYTMFDFNNSLELRKLYEYLKKRCSMAGGNYIHQPGEEMQQLIVKYLINRKFCQADDAYDKGVKDGMRRIVNSIK